MEHRIEGMMIIRSETIAALRTIPRKDFIGRVRQIVAEYMGEGLGPTAAMAEIRAALRELDRVTGGKK